LNGEVGTDEVQKCDARVSDGVTPASVFRLATTAVRVSAELSTGYTCGRQLFQSRCFDDKYVGDAEVVNVNVYTGSRR